MLTPSEVVHFFLTVEGKPLTVRAVRLMVRRAKQRVGIPRLHPHLLRHTFAIHYLMAGAERRRHQRCRATADQTASMTANGHASMRNP